MSKVEAAIGSPSEYKPKARMEVRVPKGVKMKIAGLKGVSVGDEIEVEVTGKIIEIAQRDTEDPWGDGQTLCLEPSSCALCKPEKGMSMDDAIEGSKKKV